MNHFDSLVAAYTLPPDTSALATMEEKEAPRELRELYEARNIYYPFGDLSPAFRADSLFQAKITSGAYDNCGNAYWQCIGPKGDPANTNWAQRNGRLDRIAFKSGDPNTLYVGSGKGGGLWKVNGTTGDAQPLNTDRLFPQNGISGIISIPGRIVISTGTSFPQLTWRNNEWQGSCRGVYYTEDEGQTWDKSNFFDANNNPLPNQFSYESWKYQYCSQISVNPSNTDIMFMTIFKKAITDDNADPTEYGDLYKSVDGGKNWKHIDDPVLDNRYFHSVAFHPTNGNIVYLSSQKLFKSTDGGNTWADITSVLNLLPPIPTGGEQIFYKIHLTVPSAGVASGDADDVVALVTINSHSGPGLPGSDDVPHVANYLIYHSTDAFSTSVNSIISTVPGVRDRPEWVVTFHGGIALSHDPDILYVGGRVFQMSNDGGATFATAHIRGGGPTHDDIQQIAIPPFNGLPQNAGGNAGVVFACTDGGLWRSDNFGVTFISLNKDLVINQLYGMGLTQTNNDILWGAQDNGNQIRVNNVWSPLLGGDGSYSNAINSIDPGLIACNDMQNSGMMRYTFRNITGNISTVFSYNPGGTGWNPFEYDNQGTTLLIGTNRLITVEEDNTIQNSNGTFQNSLPTSPVNLQLIFSANNVASAFSQCFSDPDVIYMATTGQWKDGNGRYESADNSLIGLTGNCNTDDVQGTLALNFFRSTNGGATWTYLPTNIQGTSGVISSVCVHPTNPDKVWITFRGYEKNYDPQYGNQNIFMSEDGGGTWINYSGTLPRALTKRVVYQNGTNDRLYLATESGVYYRDGSMSDWECYSDNLPFARIEDIEISYCDGQLYAATFGRGIWVTKLYSQWELPPSDVTVITSDQTWDNTRYLTGNLRIKEGKKLTIETPTGDDQITLFMPRNGVITVEPGGSLIVDNARITNGCDTCFWYGIVAQGAKNTPQPHANSSSHAKVVLKNGAILEHARNAVNLYDIIEGDPNKSGGIINAQGSIFRNNKRSIAFADYPTDDKSIIKNCEFYIDDNYKGHDIDYPFGSHITMWEVNGVDIYGCGFYNWDTHEQNKGKANGIVAANAGFTVRPLCLGGVPCSTTKASTFHGFRNGINISGGFENAYADYITGAAFDSNTVGVRVITKNYVTVVNSTFDIGNGLSTIIDEGDAYYLPQCPWNIGIYTNKATKFIIEENDFNGHPQAYLGNVGTLTVSSGEHNDNTIYKCNYDHLTYGGLTSRVNGGFVPLGGGGSQGIPGLHFDCNAFSYNEHDIHIGSFPNFSWSSPSSFLNGIAPFQGNYNGTVDSSTGNTFSNSTMNIVNEGHPINYMYYGSGENPVNKAGEITVASDVAASCRSSFGDLPLTNGNNPFNLPLVDMKAAWSGLSTTHGTAVSNFTGLLDNGSTSTLVSYITGATWPSTAALTTTLYGYSPYLSKTAVLATFGILDTSQFQTIVSANPDLLRDPTYYNHLTTSLTPPLSDWYVAQLEIARNTFTQRGKDEKYISSLSNEMDKIATRIIVATRLDTTGTVNDSLAIWYRKRNTVDGEYDLVGHYLCLGDTTRAQEVCDSIVVKFTLGTDEARYYLDYKKILNLAKGILADGRTFNNVLQSEVDDLNDVINGGTYETGIFAQKIWGPLTPTPDPPVTPNFRSCEDDGWIFERHACGSDQQQPLPPVLTQTKGDKYLKVSPNPAKDVVHFSYNVPGSVSDLSIVITNSVGQIVKLISLSNSRGIVDWTLDNISAGTYIYNMNHGKEKIATGKIAVIK